MRRNGRIEIVLVIDVQANATWLAVSCQNASCPSQLSLCALSVQRPGGVRGGVCRRSVAVTHEQESFESRLPVTGFVAQLSEHGDLVRGGFLGAPASQRNAGHRCRQRAELVDGSNSGRWHACQ